MTQRLEIWYMRSLYGHQLIPEKFYQYSENKCRFCGKNWNFYKDSHVEISVNIICDLTRRSRRVDFAGGETGTSRCGSLYIARFFLNRNLNSSRRQSVYENSKQTWRPRRVCWQTKPKQSDRLRVNINRLSDLTFHDYLDCIQ